jgi:hypothetical protein
MANFAHPMVHKKNLIKKYLFIVRNGSSLCHACTVSSIQGQPDPARFYEFLPNFLTENPSKTCPKA